ncbi:MAG TPA: hypothetical protein VM187_00360, partial [Niastella sp.]|nr:hypothetical protein [Niastella sp.]
MKLQYLLVFTLLLCGKALFSQGYTARIESCPCSLKTDPALDVRCGNLVVPENRKKPAGRQISIPFVYAKK